MQSQNNQKLLEIKNAEIKFSVEGGIVNAVNDISFDIIKGETLAIVGESGSGKSILTRCIIGLIDYDQGTIDFENYQNIKKCTLP